MERLPLVGNVEVVYFLEVISGLRKIFEILKYVVLQICNYTLSDFQYTTLNVSYGAFRFTMFGMYKMTNMESDNY